jgi:translation elongation factor EF-Ts
MAAGTDVEVPMDLIKKLRGMSGAPIMDCKKALKVRILRR